MHQKKKKKEKKRKEKSNYFSKLTRITLKLEAERTYIKESRIQWQLDSGGF
jgi:hypothetical protein